MRRPDNAIDCSKCNGRGFVGVTDASGNNDSEACNRCSGRGWVVKQSYADDLQPGARLMPTNLRTDPHLLALIEELRSRVMTPEERLAQQRSWALGELLLSHPDMSREEAARLVDDTILRQAWRGIHKLTEEMGELGQVIGKAGAFPAGGHPDGGPPLRQRFEEELADVEAAIWYFREMNNLDPMPTRRLEKMQRFRKWGLAGPL